MAAKRPSVNKQMFLLEMVILKAMWMSLPDPLKNQVTHHIDPQENKCDIPTMQLQQQLLEQAQETTNAVREDARHKTKTFVPLSSTEHKHSETQQIDFTSYSTNFQAHCPISFQPLGKKAKDAWWHVWVLVILGLFSYLLSNFLLHFTGEPNSAWPVWRLHSHTLHTPIAVILGVGSADDCRPVIGPTWKSQLDAGISVAVAKTQVSSRMGRCNWTMIQPVLAKHLLCVRPCAILGWSKIVPISKSVLGICRQRNG